MIDIPIIGTLEEASKEALQNFNIDFGLQLSELSETHRKGWESDGIYEGSFITEINDENINSVNDAQRALEKYSNKVLRIAVVKTNGEKVMYRFR
jgi:S1-C subfamily serine protease